MRSWDNFPQRLSNESWGVMLIPTGPYGFPDSPVFVFLILNSELFLPPFSIRVRFNVPGCLAGVLGSCCPFIPFAFDKHQRYCQQQHNDYEKLIHLFICLPVVFEENRELIRRYFFTSQPDIRMVGHVDKGICVIFCHGSHTLTGLNIIQDITPDPLVFRILS